MPNQPVTDVIRRGVDAQLLERSDRQARITTGVDAGKGAEVGIDVERQAVVGRAAADAQAERGDFRAIHVYTGRAGPAFARYAVLRQEVNHGLFQAADQGADADAEPFQIDQRVDDQLPRAVPGDVPAAVGLHQRNAVQHFGPRACAAPETERIDGIVFKQPELVRRVRRACLGEGLHVRHGPGVGRATEVTDVQRAIR